MTNGVCYNPKMNINDPCENDAQCANGIQGGAECDKHNETGIKTCACSDNSLWSPGRDACLPSELSEENGYACLEDGQCQYTFGDESSCDSRTGQCDCQGGKFFQDACLLPVQLNDNCSIDLQCKAYLGNDSFCANDNDNVTNVCKCKPGKLCTFSGESPMAKVTIIHQSGMYTTGTAIMVGLILAAGGIAGCLFFKRKREYVPVQQASIVRTSSL